MREPTIVYSRRCMIGIHGDRKFFLLTKEVEQYILAQGEEGLHQTVSHKSHIPKVMVFAANGRPRWDAGRARMFHWKEGRHEANC
jgi:hypothetical protein